MRKRHAPIAAPDLGLRAVAILEGEARPTTPYGIGLSALSQTSRPKGRSRPPLNPGGGTEGPLQYRGWRAH